MKNLQLKYLYILIICLLTNCKKDSASKVLQSSDVEIFQKRVEVCFSNEDKESAIQAIFHSKELQTFLHPEIESRIPVRLVVNEFVGKNLRIKINGVEVQFVDSLILPYGNAHEMKVIDVDCKEMSFSYSIFYPIEGAVIEGNIYRSDTSWIVKNNKVIEINQESN